MRSADIHIHTHFSDSSSSPEEVIEDALKAELDCIAITDHDTVDGIIPTKKLGDEKGIEVISGIELSTELNGRDIHILGYLFDEHNKEFIDAIEGILDSRVGRMKAMIEKLKELGLENITFDEVDAAASSRSIGRPHLAEVMIQKGYVKNFQEAFDRYLADDAPAYVTKFKQTPKEGIALIKKAGGVSVLAHPMVTKMDEIIPQLVKDGLDGIEVYYPNTPSTIIEFYEGLADKYDLIKTGGSDAHGAVKKNTHVGKVKIPYSVIEALKTKAGHKV